MARPEGETTRVLRSTMELSLDAVNTKLLEAGEKAIDARTLTKRRGSIRAKDSGRRRRSVSAAKTSKRKHTVTAKPKTKRKSPPPATQPRRNTFAWFVYSQPYNMEVGDVMALAKAAGITQGHKSQVYKIRSLYPKPIAATLAKLNPIASAEELREQDAKERPSRQPIQATVQHVSSAISLPPGDKESLCQEFVMLVWRLGLDDSKALLQQCFKSVQGSALDSASDVP